MYKNLAEDGTHNLCGKNVARLRKALRPRCSQKALAAKLQLADLDLEKNAVQRIESGERFVTDIELKVIARVFGVTTDELLEKVDAEESAK